jgi:hypothetical protein
MAAMTTPTTASPSSKKRSQASRAPASMSHSTPPSWLLTTQITVTLVIDDWPVVVLKPSGSVRDVPVDGCRSLAASSVKARGVPSSGRLSTRAHVLRSLTNVVTLVHCQPLSSKSKMAQQSRPLKSAVVRQS